MLNEELKEFVDICISKFNYPKIELKLLKRLLEALPIKSAEEFLEAIYLDKLDYSHFGKSPFSLAGVKKYVDFFLKKESKKYALDAIDLFKRNPNELKSDIKEIVKRNLSINGEGEYLYYELQNYFYEELSKDIKDLLKTID